MATQDFEDIVDDFAFLEDWEDRYRYIIEQSKVMPPLDEALKVPATQVEGCASQVWLHAEVNGGTFCFDGDSDAIIVRGLISILRKLFNGLSVSDVMRVDPQKELARLGLNEHLSSQRSNGLRAMIEKIRQVAQSQN